MKRMAIKTAAFCLILLSLAGSADADQVISLLGPKVYQRTTGAPNVFREAFPSQPGPAMLTIFNGTLNGSNVVTSASVQLNGQTIFKPDDFKKKVSVLQTPVQLAGENSLTVTLQSAPGSLITVRITQEISFEEGESGKIQADLEVASLTLDPDRCQPDQAVTITAVVMNHSRQQTPVCTLIFRADGDEISRLPVAALPGQGSQGISLPWTAPAPGRHQVSATLELSDKIIDPNTSNNSLQAALRVSGETPPIPEMEVSQIGFSPVSPTAGQPAIINLTVYNPGFVRLRNVGLTLYIDGVPVLPPVITAASQTGGDAAPSFSSGDEGPFWASLVIDSLDPGQSQQYTLPWDNVTSGQHILRAKLSNVPDLLPRDQRQISWNVVVPFPNQLYQPPQGTGKWVSLGPYQMTQSRYFGDWEPWGGKIDCLAFNPKTLDPFTAYAGGKNYHGGPSGAGVWTTPNSGTSWQPLGDNFDQMGISAVAVDPQHVNVVYCAAGFWFEKKQYLATLPGTPIPIYGPIYKSVDGGQHWQLFGHPAEGYSKLVVRYTAGGQVVVYAASNRGLLRYKNGDPLAATDQGGWKNILPYPIGDLVVHPTNPDIVYAVPYTVVKQPQLAEIWIDGFPMGVFRTSQATSLNPDATPFPGGWQDLGLLNSLEPDQTKRRWWQVHLDLFRSNPQKIYVSVLRDSGLEVHKSSNEGGQWQLLLANPDDDLLRYGNWFLRAHPTLEDWLYYGYVNLWRAWNDHYGKWRTEKVPKVHPDVHDLQFHPAGDYFLVAGDGGIYKGVTRALWTLPTEWIYGLNNDLRNAQIFDFDVCQNDHDIMLAGTQDEGTIKYLPGTGDTWKVVDNGDGMFSPIAPNNPNIQYCQYILGIDWTKISVDQGNTFSYPKHAGLSYKGRWQEQYITVDPFDPKHLLAQGPETQESLDGCDSWHLAGPPPSTVIRYGMVRRAAFHPTNVGEWFIGTDLKGQIWHRTSTGEWSLIFNHDDFLARVASMAFAPADPSILYVTFDQGAQRDRLLLRIRHNPDGTWTTDYISADLPVRHLPSNTPVIVRCVVGDPFLTSVVYVGTDKGVFRGEETVLASGSYWTWQPYNDGLPLVDVRKLIPLQSTGELRAGTHGRGLWSVNVAALE